MKVTLDSTDPLSDALRVVGAMYNVTLVVDSTTSPLSDTSQPAARKASSRRTAKNAARRGRAGDAKRSTSARGARRSASNGKAPAAPELRSWARHQGYQVGNRGRMPAAVLAAYREAHQS
ncbi:MAG TPA: histone-like nucleoid-structuring protein Lsr2 [Nocardioidaceae bacterium]|nr:histone-like nucleoid-structuring protein Lsr2 [Nocardioidaceae bacterium]